MARRVSGPSANDRWGFLGERFIAVLEATPGEPLWSSFEALARTSTSGLDEVLGVVTAVPLAQLGSFAVVVDTDTSPVLIARGVIGVTVDGVSLDLSTVRTWREETLRVGAAVELGRVPDEVVAWVSGGVVPCDGIAFSVQSDAPALVIADEPQPEVSKFDTDDDEIVAGVASSAASPTDSVPSWAVEAEPIHSADDPIVDELIAEVSGASEANAPISHDTAFFDEVEFVGALKDGADLDIDELAKAVKDAPAFATATTVETEPADLDPYGHLFQATEYRSVEGAAVREPQEPEIAVASTNADAAHTESGSTSDIGDHFGDTRAVTHLLAELRAESPAARSAQPAVPAIDPIPFASSGDAGVAPNPTPRTELTPAPAGPHAAVPSRRCPSGHLNPPHGAVCRSCSQTLVAPVAPERNPVVGVLVHADGRRIPIDRNSLIGRRPGIESTFEGSPPALVIMSDKGHISRTHCAIDVSGWTVSLIDLDSTEGTVLTLPGAAPEALRPGHPRPLLPGSLITLAGDVELRFEAE